MSVLDQTTGVSYTTLSGAITGSGAGDVLLVDAGSYVENFPDITHSLTIQAVGGMVSLTTVSPTPPNGRAVLNVPLDAGVNLTISGLEISGAVNELSRSNGAGILFEVGNGVLTVSNCYIHNNQDGILTGSPDAASPGGQMSVFIDHSEIANNGVDPSNPRYGFDHNIYAGALTELSVTNSYIHDALGGHEIKSRALTTIITDNRIQDGATATSSYDIDLAMGGIDTVTGNVIEKGASAPNRYMIHFGGEGTYASSSLAVSGNVFINDRAAGATGLFNQTSLAGQNIPASLTNNSIYNVETINQDSAGPLVDMLSGNTLINGAAPALDTSPGFTPPCFGAGTRISTTRGAIAVEDIRPGDRAVLAAGGARAVIWTGHRRAVFGADAPAEAWPVRVARGAFGPGCPSRDLVLSPDHAVFVGGVLVPIAALADGAGIAPVRMEEIVYVHVELDRHDVILAEGLPVESFLENGNRQAFDAAFPEDMAAQEQVPCAPIVRQGAIVEDIRRGLALRVFAVA